MRFKFSIKLFISKLLGWNVNSNCNTKTFFFDNFMNIFQDFNDLWHNDNLFNNLFKNIWNLDDLFNCTSYRNNLVFVSIDNLNLSFNLINNISLGNKVIFFNNLVYIDNDFSDFSISIFNGNNLFFNNFNLLNFLMDQRNFNRSVSVNFNKFVDLN